TRLVAQKLTERLGQPFVIDNRTGAGGLLATQHIARATPDGYTLLLGTDAQLAAQVTLRKSPRYDPVKDFAPIALIGTNPFGLVASAALPAQSVADLVQLAKAQPGKISYGSSGVARHSASACRAVHEHDRHQDDARSLQGHGGGAARRGRRACVD